MKTWLFSSSILLSLAFASGGGCGSTVGSPSGTTGTTSTTTGAGGSGAGGSTGSTTTTTTGTGGSSVPCGAGLTCQPTELCIVDDHDEPCNEAPMDGGACPPGTTMKMCGGIGYPCCCGAAPPSDYHCETTPLACGASPSCDCLSGVCPVDKMCMGIGGKPSEFHCITPPVP